jgi:hypothetical protein
MTVISVEQIATSYVFDLVPEELRTPAMWQALGGVQPSEEVAEMEQMAAKERVELLQPVGQVLHVYSAVAAQVIQKAILERRPDGVVRPEELPMLLTGCVASTLGNLLSLGVVHLSHTGAVSE